MAQEDNKAGGAAGSPADLWSQWYETTANMWSRILSGEMVSGESGGNPMDPYGFYRQWSEMMSGGGRSGDGPGRFFGLPANMGMMPGIGGAGSMGSMPGLPSMASMPGMQEMGQMQGMDVEKASRMGQEFQQKGQEFQQSMQEASQRWMEMLEEVRGNMMKLDQVPSDPMAAATQWYNATSGPLSKFIEDMLQREEFMEASSRFFEDYSSSYKVLRESSEQYWNSLQLPTRSDISRIATLVIALEEKVDRMDEALEEIGDAQGVAQSAMPSGAQSGAQATSGDSAVEQRIDAVEQKLDRVLAALERLEGEGSAGDSSSNGSGAEAPASSSGGSSGATSSGATTSARGIRATDAARRRAQELGVNLGEVTGTGADGQITVEDVRKRGEGS